MTGNIGAKFSRNSIKLLAVVTCLIALSSCGTTKRLLEPEPDWVLLSQGKANHLRESDVFHIKSREKYAAIKIYVYERAITVKGMKITLVNGDVLTPSLESRIDAGERSRTIELAADGKQIEKIWIRYKSEGKLFSEKALVQFGGLKPAENRR